MRVTDKDAVVLVVEDDVALRETVCEMLTWEGYGTRGAGTLDEARTALFDHPNLVLLDLMLEGESGETLVYELKTKSHAPPCVLVSASREATAIAKEHGITLLKKPFDIDRLLDVVASHVRPTCHGCA